MGAVCVYSSYDKDKTYHLRKLDANCQVSHGILASRYKLDLPTAAKEEEATLVTDTQEVIGRFRSWLERLL